MRLAHVVPEMATVVEVDDGMVDTLILYSV